jgi:hypothetical protein
VHWAAIALLVGWVSHLAGDLLFGRLPLLPWGGLRVGLGLDTGGFIETGHIKMRRFGLFGEKRQRTVLPFGPTRVAIVAGLLWVLAGLPDPGVLGHGWHVIVSAASGG